MKQRGLREDHGGAIEQIIMFSGRRTDECGMVGDVDVHSAYRDGTDVLLETCLNRRNNR